MQLGRPSMKFRRRAVVFSDAKPQMASHSSKQSGDGGSFRVAILATLAVAAGALLVGTLTLLVAMPLEEGIGRRPAHFQLQVHHLFYAIIIALANNVDNLGARIAYSIQGTKVHVLINLWISVITFVISASAAFSGAAVIGAAGNDVASTIAMAMLVGLGLWMIIQARLQSWHERIHEEKTSSSHLTIFRKPHHADVDDSKHIDFKEGTFLGVALSINNIGGGVSAGVLKIDPVLVGFLSALVSFVALFAGNYVADYFVRRHIADKAAIVGGLLLILIGIKQVF